ncbi:ATP-dependent nuclease [Nocardia takedensis]|uniref:ATP-dependent nuclease n=1 Tax=Nocardia takedensis TaxID=259390 RepID=UPI000318BAFD|nr:AAA family ATPase [Nocardia takedensis]
MYIRRINIKNYRSIQDLDISLDDYTALIGPNGSGKSSVVYALDWFFKGGGLGIADVYRDGSSPEPEPVVEDDQRYISVMVTFDSLTPADRQRLGRYGLGEQATFRRTWTAVDGKEKIVGNAMQGPGFAEARDGTRVGEYRPAYTALREKFPELPDLGSKAAKAAILTALEDWEADLSNADKLEQTSDVDASHLFGAIGTAVINQCCRMVFVPAALNIAGEVGAIGKKTALNELVGALMAAAGEKAHADWRVKHSDAIDELQKSVREGVAKSTDVQAARINARLDQFIPGTSIKFTPDIPEWQPRSTVSVRTDVIVNGIANDVARQGHGTQRAIMMTMLQAMVPDATSAADSHVIQDGEEVEDADARLAAELEQLPSLIICIEEPEIYQHPVRARTFARVLTNLAQEPNVQVIVATHSPYFVRPEQFSALRRFGIVGNQSTIKSTSIAEIAADIGKNEENVNVVVAKQLPTSFSEGFFSDRVVLVEGDTDKVVIEALAERCSMPLDAAGVSVLCMGGKGNLRVPSAILQALAVPIYVVVDGDALCSLRSEKHQPGSTGQLDALESNRKQTGEVIGWLPGGVASGAKFEGDSLSTPDFTLWHDDIESELEKWPDFVGQLTAVGGQLRTKKMAHYRAAAYAVNLETMPAALKTCLEKIAGFASKY